MNIDLTQTIKEDCNYYEELVNQKELEYYLYLNECTNSKDNGLYQLIFNGLTLWCGTLPEINAVVKSMIAQEVRAAEYGIVNKT